MYFSDECRTGRTASCTLEAVLIPILGFSTTVWAKVKTPMTKENARRKMRFINSVLMVDNGLQKFNFKPIYDI